MKISVQCVSLAFAAMAALTCAYAQPGDLDAPPTPTQLPTAQDQPPPTPAVIANPRWLERPRPEQFYSLYPPEALAQRQEGRAVLECIVAADGRLSCLVISEDPPGWGFGEATLAASRSFRMAPATIDGRPTSGGRVRVPMRWNIADEPNRPPAQ